MFPQCNVLNGHDKSTFLSTKDMDSYLVSHKLVIDAVLGHEVVVSSLLHHHTFVKAEDDVCSFDSRQAMGDHQSSSSLPGLVDTINTCIAVSSHISNTCGYLHFLFIHKLYQRGFTVLCT